MIDKLKKLPVKTQTFELEITISPSANSTFFINFASNEKQEYSVGYDAETGIVSLDRIHSGETEFSDEYKKLNVFETRLPLKNKEVKLRLFFDKSVVELFVNDGEAALTMQLFPATEKGGVYLNSIGGKVFVKEITLWPLKSVW
jgi:fructan beta-fructosidase